VSRLADPMALNRRKIVNPIIFGFCDRGSANEGQSGNVQRIIDGGIGYQLGCFSQTSDIIIRIDGFLRESFSTAVL